MEIALLRKTVVAALVALATLAGASTALADAKVRVEFFRLAQPGEAGGALTNQPTKVIAAQELTVTTTPSLSQVAPSFGDKSGNPITQGAVRITALTGAVIVDWGTAPAVTEAAGFRVEPGAPLIVPMTTGLRLSIAQAAASAGAAPTFPASGLTPITTPITSVGATAGLPVQPGRPYNVGLSGTFVATCSLQKSFGPSHTSWFDMTYVDGSPMTWSSPFFTDFTEGEADVQVRLNCPLFTSGSAVPRISQ